MLFRSGLSVAFRTGVRCASRRGPCRTSAVTEVDFPDPRFCRFDLVALGSVRSGGLPVTPDEVPDDVYLTAYGSTWDPDVLMTAYRSGMFPMPYLAPGLEDAISWWSPNPRAAFVPSEIRCTRSLTKSMRRFTVTVDTAFGDVIRACGDPRRPSGGHPLVTAGNHRPTPRSPGFRRAADNRAPCCRTAPAGPPWPWP